MNKLIVLHFDLVLYLSAVETGIFYIALAQCPTEPRDSCPYALEVNLATILCLFYDGEHTIPAHVAEDCEP